MDLNLRWSSLSLLRVVISYEHHHTCISFFVTSLLVYVPFLVKAKAKCSNCALGVTGNIGSHMYLKTRPPKPGDARVITH
jgi:hypothetical protein